MHNFHANNNRIRIITCTPVLHAASKVGNLATVRFLLDLRADGHGRPHGTTQEEGGEGDENKGGGKEIVENRMGQDMNTHSGKEEESPSPSARCIDKQGPRPVPTMTVEEFFSNKHFRCVSLSHVLRYT